MQSEYVGLRVDVCTYQGMLRGVPPLLRLLSRFPIRATFFVAMGPDCSGRALLNVWRRKGFLSKMIRTRAVSMYGFRTMLYGTLLPSPVISERCRTILRDIDKDGHEVGIHGWNHRRWQDSLEWLTPEEIQSSFDLSIERFVDILGHRPTCSAAPAWCADSRSLAIQERYSFSFASDCRGTAPFYPIVDGKCLKTVQVPVTLPTLDEVLGRSGVAEETYGDYAVRGISAQSFPVYAIHAEAEGRRYLPQCEDVLTRLRSMGIGIGCLSDVLGRARPASGEIHTGSIPGRSGQVALQFHSPAIS